MDKEKLRQFYLEKRSELDEETRKIKSDEIVNHLLNSDIFDKSSMVLLYNSFRGEVDLTAIKSILWGEGKRLFVPVTTGYENGEMRACEIEENQEMVAGKFGILEPKTKKFVRPSEIDLVLIPAVAIGEDFSRLGYGAGYYDRFLAKMPCSTPKIGIAYECQKAKSLPQEENDQKLSAYCTEAGYFINEEAKGEIIMERLDFTKKLVTQLGIELPAQLAVLQRTKKLSEKDVIMQKMQDIRRLGDEYPLYVEQLRDEFVEIDLHEMIEKFIEIINLAYNGKEIKVVCRLQENMPNVMLNEKNTYEILEKILFVACEQIGKDGKIKIKTAYNLAKNYLKITIEDSGCGTTEADFMAFKALEEEVEISQANKAMFALDIAEKLIEAVDGELEIESIIADSTIYEIKIPEVGGIGKMYL